ncbi:MAG: glycosyltransferase family 4 protein [Pseudomonadota bacterium]|nr:glycosyltransferase family 4 protein [Pseudomonadota bacterium]
MTPPLVINWPLSSLTGYGLYGLEILRQHLKRGGTSFALTDHLIEPIELPEDVDGRLRPLLEPSSQAARFLDANPSERLHFDGPVLHGVGNCYAHFKNQFRVRGRPNIGCAAIEELACPPDWRPFLQIYDMFIAISTWNADYLRSLGLGKPVHLCRQGIDTQRFFPAQRSALFGDRFVIFSGGKLEFRKGQDIVLAAFKRFQATHDDVLLVTSWQNAQMPELAAFENRGLCVSVPSPLEDGRGLNIAAWLAREGLPPGSFVDLGWQHNKAMPRFLHASDIAIFPNRCEGGTNLVAMEAIACGVPTYLAANTGQADLIEQSGCSSFRQQKPVLSTPGIMSVEGWGETAVDEVVAALAFVYENRHSARIEASKAALNMQKWDWVLQSEKLLQLIYKAG